MASSSLEVTRDIVVAIVNKPNTHVTSGDHEEIAKKVAKIFDVVYDAVQKKNLGG